MEYFHAGLIGFQLFTCIIFVILLRRFSKQKIGIQARNLIQKRDLSKYLEECTLEIFDKIEEIKYELGDIRQQMTGFMQQQISWRTVKKELPNTSQMVLLLRHKTKTEHVGFLNPSTQDWRVPSVKGPSVKHFRLDEISHWKPLVPKQNDAKS